MTTTYRLERELPKPKLPPEGEPWVWKFISGRCSKIGRRFIGYVEQSYHGGVEVVESHFLVYDIEHVRPLQPHIDLYNMPTADTVPEGEEFVAWCGLTRRKGDCVYVYDDEVPAKTVHVYARPSAVKALMADAPRTLGELEVGCVGMVDGKLVIAGDGGFTGVEYGMESGNFYRFFHNETTLDTDEHGPIYGRLVRVEEGKP